MFPISGKSCGTNHRQTVYDIAFKNGIEITAPMLNP